jgi:hypothetical protein
MRAKMLNVDEAINIIKSSINGIVVTDYEIFGEERDKFKMNLTLNGVTHPCEGHVERLRKIDDVFLEKIRRKFLIE